MKKIIILMLAMTMIFALSVVATAAPNFIIHDVEVEQGTGTQSVDVYVSIADVEDGVITYEGTVSYDDALTLETATRVDEGLPTFCDFYFDKGYIMDYSMDFDVTPGRIFKMTFTVPVDTAAVYEVGFDGIIYDIDEIDIPSTPTGTITVKGAEAPAPTLTTKGTSLYLDGGVGVKAYFNYDGAETLMVNGVAATKEADGSYSAYVEVAPKDYATQSVTFIATAADVDDDATVTTTVADMINTYKSDAKVGALATALEAYCINANAFFLGGETQAVEANITLAKPSYTGEKTINGLTFNSSSLILEGKVTIRHYFKVGAGADTTGLTLTNDGFAYAEIANIDVTDLASKKNVSVAGFSIDFSALDYVALTHESSDVKLANLVKALYNYHVAAVAYKAAN